MKKGQDYFDVNNPKELLKLVGKLHGTDFLVFQTNSTGWASSLPNKPFPAKCVPALYVAEWFMEKNIMGPSFPVNRNKFKGKK